jgi:hypothetical protein
MKAELDPDSRAIADRIDAFVTKHQERSAEKDSDKPQK